MGKEEDIFSDTDKTHKIWHQFSTWLGKTFGSDLIKNKEMEFLGKKFKYQDIDDLELSRRLVGYDVQVKIENYVKRYCKEIKIVRVDDEVYSSSDLVLVPHPKHGITVMFIPQCSTIQNQFFMYYGHYQELKKALEELEWAYEDSIDKKIKDSLQQKA